MNQNKNKLSQLNSKMLLSKTKSRTRRTRIMGKMISNFTLACVMKLLNTNLKSLMVKLPTVKFGTVFTRKLRINSQFFMKRKRKSKSKSK